MHIKDTLFYTLAVASALKCYLPGITCSDHCRKTLYKNSIPRCFVVWLRDAHSSGIKLESEICLCLTCENIHVTDMATGQMNYLLNCVFEGVW